MRMLCRADCAISASGKAQVIRHHAAVTIHFAGNECRCVSDSRIHCTVQYMPLGQPPRTAAPLPMSFRLRPRKLPAEVLQAIVGM
jgi:hypothetical protein